MIKKVSRVLKQHLPKQKMSGLSGDYTLAVLWNLQEEKICHDTHKESGQILDMLAIITV